MKKVTKAVIPAAGLGTRVLPATKAMPKGMLPLVDSLLHQILDGGLIHDGEHPLGHGLGGGQHTGAQTGGRDDSLRNFFHGSELLHHIISG